MDSPSLTSRPLPFSTRPLTIGDLLDWTIRIYRARFSKLVLSTAIFLVPVGLISGIVNGQTMTGYVNIFLAAIQNPGAFPEEQLLNTMSGRQEMLSSLACLILPLSLVATGMASLALTYHTLNTLRNQDSSIMDGIKVAWQHFWSWLGMSLMMALAFFGLMIAIVLIFVIGAIVLAFVFGGLISSIDNLPSGDGVAAGIGAICAVVCVYGLIFAAFFGPLAYLYGRWAAAIPGIVDQRWGAVESLQESWALTKGYAWRCTGYMVLLYLFYGVIYAAITALGFGLSALVVTTSSLASVVVFAIIGAVFPVLWQPIQIAAHVMLYHDLRIRNQSYDLDLQISRLEAEVTPNEPSVF